MTYRCSVWCSVLHAVSIEHTICSYVEQYLMASSFKQFTLPLHMQCNIVNSFYSHDVVFNLF